MARASTAVSPPILRNSSRMSGANSAQWPSASMIGCFKLSWIFRACCWPFVVMSTLRGEELTLDDTPRRHAAKRRRHSHGEGSARRLVIVLRAHFRREGGHALRTGRVHVNDHPLVQHKLSLMRMKTTGTSAFRSLLAEIGMLMAYEVARDLPMRSVTIETPLAQSTARVLDGKKLVLISIMRAG